jgi:hypothetical protein
MKLHRNVHHYEKLCNAHETGLQVKVTLEVIKKHFSGAKLLHA